MDKSQLGQVANRADDRGVQGVEAGVRGGNGSVDVVRQVPVVRIVVAAFPGHAVLLRPSRSYRALTRRPSMPRSAWIVQLTRLPLETHLEHATRDHLALLLGCVDSAWCRARLLSWVGVVPKA